MRSLGGLMLLAGMGVGLFVYWPAPVDRQTSLDKAQRFAATFAAQKQQASQPLAKPGLRTFSPGISLTSFARRDTPSVTRTAGGWRTSASTLSSADSYKTLAPTSPDSRYQLVVDLQQQLKRVGCYYGRVDGSWGPGSKHATQSFVERVNATLPSDKPDYVLLTLLKSQSGKVCGACPTDQLVTKSGACVPRTTIAYGQRVQDRTGAPSHEALPWKTAPAAAKSTVKPLFKPLPTSVVSTEPLPGRMAIGGPKALPPVNSVYAPHSPAEGQTSVATAAAIGRNAEAPPVASASSAPKSAKTYKRARRREGPGTPHYNLMLSLGGVY